MHVLILDTDNRVLSAGKMRYLPKNSVTVETIPEGNILDYRYIDGAFVYDPLPVHEDERQTLPTLEQRVGTLETRNAELAEAVDMILSGVTE